MKKSKKLLSILLASNLIFSSGCGFVETSKSFNKEEKEEVEVYDSHYHYYLYYGGKTVIIRGCEENPIKVIYGNGSSGYDDFIYVNDLDNNCIFYSEHVDKKRIHNEKEEEYSTIFEDKLIESGDAIMFKQEDFGIETTKKLIKED